MRAKSLRTNGGSLEPLRRRTSALRSRAARSAAGAPALAVLLSFAALPGAAEAFTPTTALGQIGNTENERRTGDGIQTVCQNLPGPGSRTSSQDDLSAACTAMVENALELQGADINGNQSLGLTREELGNTVMTVATEELAATKSLATELASRQLGTGLGRLSAIRSMGRLGSASVRFNPFADIAANEAGAGGRPLVTGGGAGDALIGSWSLFANLNYGVGDRDTTDNEDGFDYDNWAANLGGDYRLNDRNLVGAILSYGSSEVDFDVTSAVPGGGIDSDSWGVTLYGSHMADAYYIDGLVGYSSADYDVERKIVLPGFTSRTARGDTESDAVMISVGGGMDVSRGQLTYGPYARLAYQLTDVDGYTETGANGLNLTVEDQEWKSLTSVIGARGSYAHSAAWGVLVPQARLGWVHEYKNDRQVTSAFFAVDPNQNRLTTITDDPDRNYFELGLSVSAVMRNGLQAFFDYQTLLGHEYVSDHSFTLGLRREL